ncbi:MAG: hypothetical protein AB2448_01885 [Moorella sp. (in: firmicutes)]
MLVKIIAGKDLYYPGELVSLDDATARDYISAGVAELARCPECGGQLEATGSGVYCPECGAKKWEGIL